MNNIYKNIEKYSPIKKRKLLLAFDYMIADMLNDEKFNPVVTELFIRGRKLNMFFVFILKSYFAVPKNIRLNFTINFIMEILNTQELQQIAFNHLNDKAS